MISVSLKGLRARRLRTALAVIAVLLGVAMVSAAFTVTDTMLHSATSLKHDSYAGTAGVVTARTSFKVEDATVQQVPTVPASLLPRLRVTNGSPRPVTHVLSTFTKFV